MRERPERYSEDLEEKSEPLGGDPTCWLHLVCPSCGVVFDQNQTEHRPGCDEARSP